MLVKGWYTFRELADLDRLFFKAPSYKDNSLWSPPIDIFETDKEVGLRVEVPGMDKKDIQVHVENGVLSIKGTKEAFVGDGGREWCSTESHTGTFSRSFTLPETLDVENIVASYNQGVLTITLPRKEESLPKKVSVKIA